MPTVNLTAKLLASLRSPEQPGGRVEYFDQSVPGFGVRVTRDGRRTFTFLYWYAGKKCRLKLGTHPPLSLAEAREAAKLAWAEVQRGNDPRKPAEGTRSSAVDGLTLQALCAQYLKAPDGGLRLRKKSTLPHYGRLIAGEIVPAFGARHPADITRGAVREWSEALARKKPVVANRAFSVMRRVYTWALGRDHVASTPFVGIHKPAVESARERVLTPAEIVKVFEALRGERPVIAAVWELLFYTGVRPGTALAARWKHISLEKRVWEVPITKRARGNAEGTGRPFLVPLSAQAVATLKVLKPFSAYSVFVFPGGSPRRATLDTERNLFSPQKSTDRIRKRTGIADFMMRDTRRTVATGLAELGVAQGIISKVLDHTLPGESVVTPIYSRYAFLDEKRDALDRWGSHLESLLTSKPEAAHKAHRQTAEEARQPHPKTSSKVIRMPVVGDPTPEPA